MRFTILISLFAAGLVLAMTVSSEASHQATVSGGSWSFPMGSTGNEVEIKVTGLPAEGLGASDVTIAFDSSVLEVTACTAGDMAGACNPNAPVGPARPAGFAAPAIPSTSEPVVIGRITFSCVGAPGSSTALTLTVNVEGLLDGSTTDIPHVVQDGNVVCFAPATPTPTPVPTPIPTASPTASPTPVPTASPTPGPTTAPTATPVGQTPAPTPTLWGDVDCDGTVGTRDSQAILRNVLEQPALSQTPPCPLIGALAQVSD